MHVKNAMRQCIRRGRIFVGKPLPTRPSPVKSENKDPLQGGVLWLEFSKAHLFGNAKGIRHIIFFAPTVSSNRMFPRGREDSHESTLSTCNSEARIASPSWPSP